MQSALGKLIEDRQKLLDQPGMTEDSPAVKQFDQRIAKEVSTTDTNLTLTELAVQKHSGTPEERQRATAAINELQKFRAPGIERDIEAIAAGEPGAVTRMVLKQGYREQLRGGVASAEQEARFLNSPIGESAQLRISALLNAKRIMTSLKTRFSDDERAKFVGILRNPIQRVLQFTKQDPRFAEFQALVTQAQALAFGEGGKQLTPLEAAVVWGFVPTGTEMSVADFAAKIEANLARADYLTDLNTKLAITPRKLIDEVINKLDKELTPNVGEDTPEQAVRRAKLKAIGMTDVEIDRAIGRTK